MRTLINAKDAAWTRAIQADWNAHVAPRFKAGETCQSANYYTPRPYVDEYNRGSNSRGFVYVVNPGRRVCLVQLVPVESRS